MKRPENILNPKDYDKPQSFERDWEAEIYYSYIEAQKYIDYLESEVKKLRIGAVEGRSEQFICPECKSQNVYEFTFTGGIGCNSCGHQWAR